MIVTEGKTIQQVINEIGEALAKQGTKCISPTSADVACLYGDEKGNHCAIGWLLPEDREELMDYAGGVIRLIKGVDAGELKDLGPNEQFIRENEYYLNVLQRLHDCESGFAASYYLSSLVKSLYIDQSNFKTFIEKAYV